MLLGVGLGEVGVDLRSLGTHGMVAASYGAASAMGEVDVRRATLEDV